MRKTLEFLWSSQRVVAAGVGLTILFLGGFAWSQSEAWLNNTNLPQKWSNDPDLPQAEFHLARLAYRTNAYASSRGPAQPMWRVDYPEAEIFFLPALSRLTNLSVAPAVERNDIRHYEATDERLFDYPFLLMQQPGAGRWTPTEAEAAALREYLERGGFLLVDDFHGQSDYYVFQQGISKVFPDREVIEIPDDDPMMNVFFNLDDRLQIPGERHLGGRFRGGGGAPRMEGPPYWLGIYDEKQRLMVGINFNIDMGDGWEHADDPYYPAEMTGQAYRLGVNYVIYAMTH